MIIVDFQLDKQVITEIAAGNESYVNRTMIKQRCKGPQVLVNSSVDQEPDYGNETERMDSIEMSTCKALFNQLNLSDAVTGGILLAASLVTLCTCLILLVKMLNSMLRGRVAVIVTKSVNSNLPGRFSFLTGYVCMLIGFGVTVLVQSSSVFTSTLTPLAGVGVISLETVYPLTLGSNLGTTMTGILASLAATGAQLHSSIQIALCHLFFNLSGIMLYYPIPFMRFPIPLAKLLGRTTAKYRWFSIVYLILAFLIIPGGVFALSLAGRIFLMGVTIPLLAIVFVVILVNVIQNKFPRILPNCLRTWDWLPQWLHSLKPYDTIVIQILDLCQRCWECCQPGVNHSTDVDPDMVNSRTVMMVEREVKDYGL